MTDLLLSGPNGQGWGEGKRKEKKEEDERVFRRPMAKLLRFQLGDARRPAEKEKGGGEKEGLDAADRKDERYPSRLREIRGGKKKKKREKKDYGRSSPHWTEHRYPDAAQKKKGCPPSYSLRRADAFFSSSEKEKRKGKRKGEKGRKRKTVTRFPLFPFHRKGRGGGGKKKKGKRGKIPPHALEFFPGSDSFG